MLPIRVRLTAFDIAPSFSKEGFMAMPIRETPVLTGKEARMFVERMKDAHNHPVPIEEYKRAEEIYNKMKESAEVAQGWSVTFPW